MDGHASSIGYRNNVPHLSIRSTDSHWLCLCLLSGPDCSDELRRETLAAAQLVRQLCQQLVSASDEEQLVRQCRALPLPAGVPAPSASDPLLLLVNTLTELTVSLPLQSVYSHHTVSIQHLQSVYSTYSQYTAPTVCIQLTLNTLIRLTVSPPLQSCGQHLVMLFTYLEWVVMILLRYSATRTIINGGSWHCR